MTAPPTLADARALLAALTISASDLPRLALLVRCSACRSEAGVACRTPSGGLASRPHMRRQDRAWRLAMDAPTWLSHELLLFEQGDRSADCDPPAVHHRLAQCALARLLTVHGIEPVASLVQPGAPRALSDPCALVLRSLRGQLAHKRAAAKRYPEARATYAAQVTLLENQITQWTNWDPASGDVPWGHHDPATDGGEA